MKYSWFVYLVFRLRKATPLDSTKVNVEHAGFRSRVQERFLITSLMMHVLFCFFVFVWLFLVVVVVIVFLQ